jgi:ABC-2 type transport system ATP-binding protein
MLLGTLTPTHGTITYTGHDFSKHPIAALKNIGYASGYDKLPARLTIVENLDIVGRIYGLQEPFRSHQIAKLLRAFGLEHLHNRQTGRLSAGQATRVLLAKAFLADPDIVLLDEPTASLDPDVAHEVRQFILAQRKERGISMLITSHNMDEVTELCDRVIVLKQGSIIANDTPHALAQSISQVRIHLTVTENAALLTQYLQSSGIPFSHEADQFTLEVDEHAIAHVVTQMSERKILYCTISIDKPTLADYFLSVARHKETV